MKKREKKANNRPGRGENGNFLGAAESRTLPGSSAPSRSRTFRSRPFPAPAALPRLYPDGIHMEFPASGGSEPPLLGLFQLFPLFPLNCSRLFGVLGVLFFVSSPLSQPNLIYFGADPVFPGASRSEPPPLPFGFLYQYFYNIVRLAAKSALKENAELGADLTNRTQNRK